LTRVLLIDDHDILRDGIKRVFEELPGHFEFGEATTYSEARRLAQEQSWSLAVLDLSLDMRDGLDLLKEMKRLRPDLPVLILSMHSENHYARRSFRAGAAGYVSKSGRRKEFVEAVRKVLDGGRYVSPTLAEELAADLHKGDHAELHEVLSDRELQVLRLIASGKTVGQIAVELSLSDKTVSTYRARILQKTGMKTNAELTRYAIEKQLA
jgi:two-component system, NarL family, invasion response regulator UvrY